MTCWWSTRRSRRTRAAASCRSMPSWTFCGLCGRRTPPSREARRRQVMWPASAADRRLCRSRAMTCLGLVRLLVAATTCSLVRLLAHSALARGRSPTRSRSRSTARGERSDGAPAVSPASTGVAATADVDLVEQRGRASTDASVRLRARSAAPDSSVRTRQRSASCERGARVAESRRPVRMAASRAKATLAALADRDVDSAVDAPLEPLTAEQQASISMQALRRNCAHVGSVSRRRSCSATPRRLEPGGAGGGGGGGRQSTRTRVEFSVVIARGEGEQTCAALAARAARCERPAIVSSGDTDAIVHLSRQLLMVAKHDVALFDRLAALVSVWSGNRRASLHSALAQLRRDFPDVEPQHIYLAHVLTGCDTTRQHSARVGFPTALRRVMRAKSPARVWLSDVVGDLDALGFFKKARYASFKKSLQLHERAVAESDQTIDAVARALAAGSATAGSCLRVGSCHLDKQRDAVARSVPLIAANLLALPPKRRNQLHRHVIKQATVKNDAGQRRKFEQHHFADRRTRRMHTAKLIFLPSVSASVLDEVRSNATAKAKAPPSRRSRHQAQRRPPCCCGEARDASGRVSSVARSREM
jgi:hypothetical protein